MKDPGHTPQLPALRRLKRSYLLLSESVLLVEGRGGYSVTPDLGRLEKSGNGQGGSAQE